MSDDDDPAEPTKREGPRRQAMWMAPTVGADTLAPPTREVTSPALSVSAFDPPAERYAEQAELGRGGMGRVVEAVDRALGRSVAIKQSLATSAVDLARFEREVRITARLQHPSVIPILDVGRDDHGHPFYIMRKIEGEPLADRVEAAATVRERVALISELLGAIDAAAYAHARRIIHRDIKPWNILLGPFGETLLIDWGIARELDDEHPDPAAPEADADQALTRLGVAQGTPGFLAPEQARGEVVDARADVYSLGATLYFVLTNQLPYGRIAATEAIARASAGTPPDFSLIPDEVPRELVAITIKAMAAAPSERYADAGELAADVRRFLAGQLVAAHAYSTRERLIRFVRRHRIAVTVAAIAVVAVAVVSTLSLRQVVRDRDAAEQARVLADDRADEALLQRARSLLDSDPTSAIALLRELRPESPRWPAVREIVRAGIRGGVERQLVVHGSMVGGLRFSDDGAWLASGSESLQVHAIPSGETRTIAKVSVDDLIWWGLRTLAIITSPDGRSKRVRVVEVETGAGHELDVTDPVELVAFGDRLVVRDSAGAVVMFGRDRSRTVVATEKIQRIASRGRVLVAASGLSLTVIDDAGTHEVAMSAFPILRLAISPDGTRVAALSGAAIREWDLGDLSRPPNEWKVPRSRDLEYVGLGDARLIAWAEDGSGFVSPTAGKALWTTPPRRSEVLVRRILPFEGGAILATDHGPYAIWSAHGVVPMPHRAVGVKHVAVDRTGRFLAFGLGDGRVLLDDLGFASPQLLPVARGARLVGYADGKVVMTGAPQANRPDVTHDALDVHGLTLFDPVTRQPTHAEAWAMDVHVDDGIILASDGFRRQVFDTHGKLLFELEAPQVMTGHGTVSWVDLAGGVWRRSAVPLGDAVKVSQLPPGIRIVNGRDNNRGELVTNLRTSDGDITLSLSDGTRTRAVRVTPTGLEDIPLPPGNQILIGRLGGVWWSREAIGLERALWRGSHRIPLEHDINQISWLADRVWVLGGGTLSELDATGHLLHRFEVPVRSLFTARTTAYGIDTNGVVVLAPSANLISLLRAPGAVDGVAASPDGERVFAMLSTPDGERRLASWSDPVPDDPTALRRFLDTITNARLSPSSYALTWDRARE